MTHGQQQHRLPDQTRRPDFAGRTRGGQIVGINQMVWDVGHEHAARRVRRAARPTHPLRPDRHPRCPRRRRTASRAERRIRRFRHDLNFGQTHDPGLKEYRKDLLDALKAARAAGVAEKDVATASVFTTMSTTAVLERSATRFTRPRPRRPTSCWGRAGRGRCLPWTT